MAKGNDKTGTQAVKTPPPKETARITVKPSLPTARPAGSATAGVKPAVAAGAVAATAAALTPAAPAAPAAVRQEGRCRRGQESPTRCRSRAFPAFEEDKSTVLTTSLAGAAGAPDLGHGRNFDR